MKFSITLIRDLNLLLRFETINAILITHSEVSLSFVKIRFKPYFLLPSPNFPSTSFLSHKSIYSIFLS